MKSVFQFREGSHLRGDAQVVGERLESIRAKRNALTPELVLKDASNIRSPLHPYFEWDDAKAAEQHRLQQAGHLIRCVSVTFEDVEAPAPRQVNLVELPVMTVPPRPVRAFLAIKDGEGESGYVGTRQAMADPEMRRQVLARAHSEMDAVGRKYRELAELSQVFLALDKVAETLTEQGQPA